MEGVPAGRHGPASGRGEEEGRRGREVYFNQGAVFGVRPP